MLSLLRIQSGPPHPVGRAQAGPPPHPQSGSIERSLTGSIDTAISPTAANIRTEGTIEAGMGQMHISLAGMLQREIWAMMLLQRMGTGSIAAARAMVCATAIATAPEMLPGLHMVTRTGAGTQKRVCMVTEISAGRMAMTRVAEGRTGLLDIRDLPSAA